MRDLDTIPLYDNRRDRPTPCRILERIAGIAFDFSATKVTGSNNTWDDEDTSDTRHPPRPPHLRTLW